MEKAIFKNAKYVESSNTSIQGNRTEIKKYIGKGYRVVEERDGYWILSRPCRINVELENSTGKNTFNMKNDILNYYGRTKMTEKLFEKFYKDATKGKIQFYMEGMSYSFR